MSAWTHLRGGWHGVLVAAYCLAMGAAVAGWGQPVGHRPGQTWTNPADGLTYVSIPPTDARGSLMGCSKDETGKDGRDCLDDEKPAHRVRLTKGFWMGETEVTQAAYVRVTGKANPSNFRGANLPVETVSWAEAGEYCKAIGGRLPTEAEWEYAARAGSASSRYGALGEVAWYGENSNSQAHPVKGKRANAWGLYDTLGNVYEWTSDWFGKEYFRGLPQLTLDPGGPGAGTLRVVRGGSWRNIEPMTVRVSDRNGIVPGYRSNSIGFRCLREVIP